MTTIDKAWDEYQETQAKAAIAYDEYWQARIRAENIILGPVKEPNRWPYCTAEAQVGPHRVRFHTDARKLEGAYFYVEVPNQHNPQFGPSFRAVKVKSERGWEKFLRRLSAPVFK